MLRPLFPNSNFGVNAFSTAIRKLFEAIFLPFRNNMYVCNTV
jgi:hypothetical protein